MNHLTYSVQTLALFQANFWRILVKPGCLTSNSLKVRAFGICSDGSDRTSLKRHKHHQNVTKTPPKCYKTSPKYHKRSQNTTKASQKVTKRHERHQKVTKRNQNVIERPKSFVLCHRKICHACFEPPLRLICPAYCPNCPII